MKLVACKHCHAQYDVSDVAAEQIDCRCGAQVVVEDLASKDLAVHRCSSCGAHVEVGRDGCEYCGSPIVRDPRLLSLICPECCARNANDARFCGACGVVFDPQPVEVEKRELPCPACTCLMPARVVGGIAINECPKCNGLWCPEQGFESLIARATQAKRSGDTALLPRKAMGNPAAGGVQYRKCPACDSFMQRRNFRKTSGVVVDVCAAHGTWLDADELEQIAGYLLSGGRPQAERFMRENAARDQEQYRAARAANASAQYGTGRSSYTTGGFAGRIEEERGASLLGFLASLLD